MNNYNLEELDFVQNNTNRNAATIRKGDEKAIDEIKTLIKDYISKKYEIRLKREEVIKGGSFEAEIRDAVIDFVNEANYVFEPASLKRDIIENFMVSLSGYGILQPLMDDDAIEEIYIYAPDKIWYLKNGKKILSSIKFENSDSLRSYIDNVLGRIGRTANTKNPIEDGRMPDGSRVAVSADVLSPNGYTMNIRKFRRERIHLDTLIKLGTIDEKTKDLLIGIIKSKLNTIVSGGTASGKTTLLNAMAEYIPQDENVESIEDNIELQLNREFWLQLETRKANLEGTGEITMNDLLVHLLRRSPDRIIVGEIREGKVADTFMNAINTGHDGCLTTIHANSAERCRSRLAKLASTATGQPYKSTLDDFDHSINIVIQLKKSEVLNKRIITEIDWIQENGPKSETTMVPIVKYNFDTNKFEHIEKLPEAMQKHFDEYSVEF